MRLIPILAVLCETCLLLECLHSLLGFRAKLAVSTMLEGISQRQQRFLQLRHIGTRHILLQQATAQGKLHRCRLSVIQRIAVVNEGQFIPVKPGAVQQLGLDAAIIETAPLYHIAIAHVIADMTFLVNCQANHLRDGTDLAPRLALGLGIGEHAACSLVWATISTILVADRAVRANSIQHRLTTTGPGIALCTANAVCHHLLVCDVLLVACSAAGLVVAGILVRLTGEQAAGGFVAACAVPIRLAYHPKTVGREVFIGERRIQTISHR